MQNSRESDFFVADWRVRPDLGCLERGDTATAVEARSMQVLSCLSRHAPNMVSRQRLVQEVWGEAFVTDEVLSHAVWELRKAFGDDARNPRYIQTIAKKGYRLLAPVTLSAAAEVLAPGCRIAHYEILELLGAGAMGEVYKARDQRLGRVVALKFLPTDLTRDPSARRRFLHEARAVALLDHPNVATIYEVGESEGGRIYLTLAFYEGETLQRKLERGPLPLSEAVGIARQIARGLAAAHQRQIVHRDVKPANVVVLPDGTVKLLDFGLAKVIGATSLTRLGASPGTPAYKSPEQTRGEKVDPRSDLWALGVVLYEMATGRQPFRGEYEQAVIYSILNESPDLLEGSLPSELAEVIGKALAKDPAERYSTAEELAEDLEAVPLGEFAPRRMRTRRRLIARGKWLVGSLAILVVLGVVLSVWYWEKHRWDFSTEVARWLEQGDRLEWRGDTRAIFANAEGAYRKALNLEPGNPLVKAQLAALLCRIESQFPDPSRRQEIRRLIAEAVESAPDEPMPWVAQAKLLLLDGDPEEAEVAAREAVEHGRDFDRSHTMMGEALIALGRREEGFKELEAAVNMEHGFLRARLVKAFRLQDANRLDEAAVELRKVLEYDPDHPTANQSLGSVYLSSGRYMDALPFYRKAFEASQDYRAANGLGLIYLNQNHLPEAIEAFEDAYRLEPNPTTARNLAECHELDGRKEEALRWYEIAVHGFDLMLDVGGSQSVALYGRSFCLAKLGRYDEALVDIQKAIALEPNQSNFLFRAAQIYAIAGQREEVYSYIKRAIEGGAPREDFRSDPAFRAFQDDPKFRALIESVPP